MKNVLMKFAGLFVEKVPVDEHGNPIAQAPRPSGASPHATSQQPAQPVQPTSAVAPGTQPLQQLPGQQPMPGAPNAPMPGMPATTPPTGPGGIGPVAVALRAWVPQEYAAHLAPHGLHVIAAGGAVTSEQAIGWGADVLVVSAECLGQDVQLLQQPQLPTVFITPQPVMIPDTPGVVQVQEPLRASDVAQAARDAVAAFAAARR